MILFSINMYNGLEQIHEQDNFTSNAYHQEDKITVVWEGGKMLILGGQQRPCWGGDIWAETWMDKGDTYVQTEGRVFQAEGKLVQMSWDRGKLLFSGIQLQWVRRWRAGGMIKDVSGCKIILGLLGYDE